jgi:pyruvate/2-oxoglutarate dehydrogenase complex dihydrolipoamide dehydrogenase (E3) component
MEKGSVLGGTLAAIATPSFKQELRQMVEWWQLQLGKLEVNVRLNTGVTPETPELTWADTIVVATGGRPIRPAIPGITGDNVVEVLDYHLDRKPIRGERVVIAGGGLSGCDAGLELAMKGKAVTIVEMLDGVARDLNVVNRLSLQRLLGEHGVRTLTRHRVKEFRATGLVAEGPDGNEVVIEADTVVIAFGMLPEDTLARAIQAKWPEVFVIGDCVKPAKVGDAVRAGFAAGWQID